MTILLMRHGEPDWDLVAGARWRGAANDLAPLTALGREQAADAAELLRVKPPALVVSSPMTRALQTAALVATTLAVPLQVELDLREWLPDETYQWASGVEVAAAYADLVEHGGVRPDDSRTWEPLADVRERALGVLAPYVSGGERVLAVCHEVLIHALTGLPRTGHAEVRPLEALSA